MDPHLLAHLERLYRELDHPRRLRSDPVAWPRRYTLPEDQEVAAVFASALAYGRVSLFTPVLGQLFAIADAAGGPRAWVEAFDPATDAAPLHPLRYRWNRGIDFILLATTLGRIYRSQPSLEALTLPAEGSLQQGLARLIRALRAEAVAAAPSCGFEASRFADLPRGFRYFLPSPADGSACKRWNMFLRWMIRPPREGIDFGLWTRWRPAALTIPLDTHVLRIARFIGLTDRSDGSWRTAHEITERLRNFDADDPVRFDFSLAHLGISGDCRGRRDPHACPTCPLDPVCQAPGGA